MPIGYDKNNENKITLRDYVNNVQDFGYVPFKKLDIEKKAEITIDRINAQYKYKVFMGIKVVDKKSETKELENLTSFGKILIEIEELTIESVLKGVDEIDGRMMGPQTPSR